MPFCALSPDLDASSVHVFLSGTPSSFLEAISTLSAGLILPEELTAISLISRSVITSASRDALDWNNIVDGPSN